MIQNDDKEKNENNDLDIEIVLGDDSELNFSEVEDSINSLRPKDKVIKKNVIIPKAQNKNNETNTENEDNKNEDE